MVLSGIVLEDLEEEGLFLLRLEVVFWLFWWEEVFWFFLNIYVICLIIYKNIVFIILLVIFFLLNDWLVNSVIIVIRYRFMKMVGIVK